MIKKKPPPPKVPKPSTNKLNEQNTKPNTTSTIVETQKPVPPSSELKPKKNK